MYHTHFLPIAMNSKSVIPQPGHGKPPHQIDAQPLKILSSQRDMQLHTNGTPTATPHVEELIRSSSAHDW